MGLCATSASAQVFRVEVVDAPDTVQNELLVQAVVYSPRPLTSVTAEVPGRPPVALAFDAATDRWTGTLSFAGLAQNTTYTVTLRAIDDLANAALPFQYNVRQDPQPPVITITDPTEGGFYSPDIRLRATCSDGGVPCKIDVTAENIPGAPMPGFRFLAAGVGSIDAIVSLQAGQQRIRFAGTDAANATKVDEFRTVVVDTSPFLKLQALTFAGRILDISSDRAILLDDVVPQRLLLYDRATTVITVLRTLHLEDVTLAKLVADAAVYNVFNKNTNTTRIFEWRTNVTTDLGPMAGFAIRAAGTYIAWHSGTGPSLIRRNVAASTNVTIVPAPSTSSAGFSFDLGSNGDVVWNADESGHLQVFRARGELPTTTQLTTDATSKVDVLTDGTNVIFKRQPSNPPLTDPFAIDIVLITPGGEEVLAQSTSGHLGSPGQYAVENGWTAFPRINGFLREIWRRAPDGTLTRLNSGFSSIQQLEANGDVLVTLHTGPRVLFRANGTRQELHQFALGDSIVEGEHFGLNGKFVFLDGEWHVATGPYLLKFSAAAQSILAEGSTGSFFDTDIVIFNPSATTVEAKVRYLREVGANIENTHQLGPRSHTLIHADGVPGVESAAFSTVVEVADGSPLVVERLMTWDSNGYGGHASNATDRPRRRWMFAEGAEGVFDTFFLLVNDNNDPVDVRMTFLREGLAPLAHTLTVGAHARRTFHAGELPGLVNVAFSTIVDSDQPILAERAMYWNSPIPDGPLFWGGGHDAVGAPELSHRWFFAEGATGPLFDTFILMGNPHATTVVAQLIFHTEDGTQVAKQVSLPPLSRTTVNIETLDPLIASVGVATVVVVPFETPVIAERALYWAIDGSGQWTDGHASFGATTDASRWGVSDGRVGGDRNYQTFVLVNNSFGTTPAPVKVTFIRDDGQEFVRDFVVQSGQRLTILAHGVPELADSTFSAIVETPVENPVSVERATYWDVNGVVWAAGANVVGTRLP